MKPLILSLLVATAIVAADEVKVPSMPSEVTLTSGRILRNVHVIRWEKDRVVLKHSGGADPIAFTLIKSPTQETIRAMATADQERLRRLKIENAKLEQMKQQARQEIAEAAAKDVEIERQNNVIRENASRAGTLVQGQTMEQVRQALGTHPQRQNEYAGGTQIQAIYYHTDGVTVHYVYFTNGRVTTWQKINRRR